MVMGRFVLCALRLFDWRYLAGRQTIAELFQDLLWASHVQDHALVLPLDRHLFRTCGICREPRDLALSTHLRAISAKFREDQSCRFGIGLAGTSVVACRRGTIFLVVPLAIRFLKLRVLEYL